MDERRRRFVQLGAGGVATVIAGYLGLQFLNSDGGGGDGEGPEETDADAQSDVTAPSVFFAYEETDDELVVRHTGGSTFDSENVVVRGPVNEWIPTSEVFASGDRMTLVLTERASSGDTIEIVYVDPESGGEAIMDEYVLSG